MILKTAVYRDEEYRRRGLEAGAVAYFDEPFDPQALIAVVRMTLRHGSSPARG